MGVKEKLVKSLEYTKKVGGDKKGNNVQAQQTIKANNLSGMLAGTQGANKVNFTQTKSNSVWTNLKNSFTQNNQNIGTTGSMYDVNPLELQKNESMILNPKEMYQSDVANNYNRLDMSNSIFGQMKVDGNKDVLKNVNNVLNMVLKRLLLDI